ncbi:MAG: hypothetical protein IID44_06855 [Planctomycetes bacterium]|nr:hypothetical protein [Planctomycetota bacterium]
MNSNKKQIARNTPRQRTAVVMAGCAICLLSAAVVISEAADANYRRAEIWYGTKRLNPAESDSQPSDVHLKSTATELLQRARRHASGGDVVAARRLAEWAQRCPVGWKTGELSPGSFLASLPPARRNNRRRPKVSSYPISYADRYSNPPEPPRVTRLPADTRPSRFEAAPVSAWPNAPAARDAAGQYPDTNPLRRNTRSSTATTPTVTTSPSKAPAQQPPGRAYDSAGRRQPVFVQPSSAGGFWAGMLAGIAIIVLLIVGLLWRLKARGGAVLRLEFLTPQGLDEASLAALASTVGARQPSINSSAARQAPAAAPQPVQAPETFADKKIKVAQQREKREAAMVEHIFQENLKLREQFQSNKVAVA